jgi:hypothetical protein
VQSPWIQWLVCNSSISDAFTHSNINPNTHTHVNTYPWTHTYSITLTIARAYRFAHITA